MCSARAAPPTASGQAKSDAFHRGAAMDGDFSWFFEHDRDNRYRAMQHLNG